MVMSVGWWKTMRILLQDFNSDPRNLIKRLHAQQSFVPAILERFH